MEDFLLFYGHQPRHGDKAVFSQWHLTSFIDNNNRYRTAEHWMMWSKAVLFGDTDIADEILKIPHQGVVKDLGRKISNFDEGTWIQHRESIVYRGNILKFGQNPTARKILLDTGDKILVEASPYDRIWGIGLGPNDPRASDRKKWRGMNLLGESLMKVRETFKSG